MSTGESTVQCRGCDDDRDRPSQDQARAMTSPGTSSVGGAQLRLARNGRGCLCKYEGTWQLGKTVRHNESSASGQDPEPGRRVPRPSQWNFIRLVISEFWSYEITFGAAAS